MAAAIQGRMASCRFSITYSKFLHGVFRRGYAQAELQFPHDINIEEEVLQKMERESIKRRKHPGRFAQNILLPVPEKLVSAVDILIAKYGKKSTADEAKKLDSSIMGRHPPPEPEVLQKKVDAIGKRLEKKNKKDPAAMSEEELDVYIKNKRNMIQYILRKTSNLQKSIDYTGYTTIVYLLARLSKNYNIIRTCLSEIEKRNPDFAPSAVYNVGSGLGTAVWASNSLWGSAVKQYYCVDKSTDMSTIARLLLQGGDEYKKMAIPEVFFRDKPPSHSSLPFPLVVSAFTLMEQPTRTDRLELVNHLWKMTSEYLVLIENGTYAGHSLIQEAKEWIQESSMFISDDTSNDEPHVFAPCPHDMKCPKFAIKDIKIACTFSTSYKPLKQSKIASNKLTTLYSYVILKRGKVDTSDVKWPRIVQEMKHKDHHSHCQMCSHDGSLRHYVVSKKKTQRPVYEIIRRSHWGDKVPIDLKEASTEGALYYSEEGVRYRVKPKQKPKHQQIQKQQYADLMPDNTEQLENVIDSVKGIFNPDDSADQTDENAY
ncbi:methyltransferase-like protein 17, mitochondrial [Mizuhopecten yessoensis]|uniref:Methyltransferase-like protein 17, mitochondrial n=1 Tax=Mizuhopecten yessoensis TaxID=6573 RepID=A0A210PNA6_MIZYE|nr:methyltransferase-like protein 17, mitochondrial [Mizuhopecten yessoensis]OWF37947.1 Methyltransferase-like protein 17, mitochondrial [Mizuhopecten yessoensis]